MMEKLATRRRGYSAFATDDDFEIIRRVYDQLGTVVSAHPGTFHFLKVSIRSFKSATKAR